MPATDAVELPRIGSLSAGEMSGLRRRAVVSCVIGNFFELFDFAISGFFAVAIGHSFFRRTTQSFQC